MYCQIRMRELLLLAIYLRKVRVILENPIYYSGLSTMQKFNVAWNGNSIGHYFVIAWQVCATTRSKLNYNKIHIILCCI